MSAGLKRPDLESMEEIGRSSASNGMEDVHRELYADGFEFLSTSGLLPESRKRTSYNLMLGGGGYSGIKLNILDPEGNITKFYYVVCFDYDQHTLVVYDPGEDEDKPPF